MAGRKAQPKLKEYTILSNASIDPGWYLEFEQEGDHFSYHRVLCTATVCFEFEDGSMKQILVPCIWWDGEIHPVSILTHKNFIGMRKFSHQKCAHFVFCGRASHKVLVQALGNKTKEPNRSIKKSARKTSYKSKTTKKKRSLKNGNIKTKK